MFCSIVMFPLICPAGCYGRATFPGEGGRLNSCFIACPPTKVTIQDPDGKNATKGRACASGTLSWRSNPGSFMHKLSNTIVLQKLARLIYWFAQTSSPKQISSRTGIPAGSASHAYLWIRSTIMNNMLKLAENEMIGGGIGNPNLVVLVDET